jgi:hypothetical protein
MEPSLSAGFQRLRHFAQYEHNGRKTKPAWPVVQI